MSRSQALVLAGHGSQRHRHSSAPLHAHADRIRESGVFDEVRIAFWKEEPSLRDVRAVVESDVAYVVPVLTSEGYFADRVFPRELGLEDGDVGDGAAGVRDVEDGADGVGNVGDGADGVGDVEDGATGAADGSTSTGPRIRYAEPVGTHEEMTPVIESRVESAVEGPRTDVGVALVGHGTERHERSALSTVEHARRLRERGRYAAVDALFLDEEPRVGDLYDRLDAAELVVVPLFVADGYHTTRDVPDAIDHPGVGESARIDGRLVHYAGAVGTEPSLAAVIVERAVEAGANVDAGSSGGGPTAPAEAFRRRVDDATGGTEWGELSIAERSDGYEVRHREDAGLDRRQLRSLDRPRDLRVAVRTDDGGRYRPLSGARTLPTGWVLSGLDHDGLVRAVSAVYPASVAHWWDARNGALDVTHFRETVDRQTGIYADLDGFDGEALDAAAEAVCGDCVRRRCWEAGPGEPIDADPGDVAIPCPEACPFFLSAAHAFDEAVAGDHVDVTGAADLAGTVDPEVAAGTLEDPGNRYRVRFARALARRDDAEPTTVSTGGDR